MATFTDKELIKEIKERIGSLDVRDNIERRAYEIALASLEAVPVAWLHSDNGLGIPAITRSKNVADSWLSKGCYVQPLYIAKPVPVVSAVLERLRAIVADPRALPRRKEWVSGQQYSYVLLENVEAMVDEACRAAMLQGDK
ncbi:valyl-tRNA synthetase [Escherichia coli]|nr:valyl-tRNA synthetase [Escherichia coli]